MWETRVWRLNFEIHENINRQCLCFGFALNWNWRPSIEAGFLFWTMELQYSRLP
jgi:hypothetical protein